MNYILPIWYAFTLSKGKDEASPYRLKASAPHVFEAEELFLYGVNSAVFQPASFTPPSWYPMPKFAWRIP